MVKEGYCNIKRSKKWNGYSENENYIDTYNKVIAEEKPVTIIIIISGNSFDETLSFIKSFSKDSVGSILVGAITLSSDKIKLLIDILNKSGIKWRLEDIKNTEMVENSSIVDYLMQFAQTSWVLAGENLPETMNGLLEAFDDSIDDVDNSYLALLNDDDMLVNRFCTWSLVVILKFPSLKSTKLDKDGICSKRICRYYYRTLQ
jgi:hypothetical protein